MDVMGFATFQKEKKLDLVGQRSEGTNVTPTLLPAAWGPAFPLRALTQVTLKGP